MGMEIRNTNDYGSDAIKTKRSLNTNRSMSTEEQADTYFKNLQKKYSNIDIKRNTRNIYSRDNVSLTLSPDLIKKALKDPKVDKRIRKSLDDLVENKKLFKFYGCTKDGKEVSNVSFYIDERERTSCNIKFKDSTSSENKTKEEKRTVAVMIENQIQVCNKKFDLSTSLFYKYIKLLSENNFLSLDIRV